jgi:hypothetical protein
MTVMAMAQTLSLLRRYSCRRFCLARQAARAERFYPLLPGAAL